MISSTSQLAISSLWINGCIVVLSVVIIIVLLFAISVLLKMREIRGDAGGAGFGNDEERFKHYINTLNSKQIEEYRKIREKAASLKGNSKNIVSGLAVAVLSLVSHLSYGQSEAVDAEAGLMSSGGVIITLILIAIPIIVGILLLAGRVRKSINRISDKNKHIEARKLANYIESLPEDELEEAIKRRQAAVDYQFSQQELSGNQPVVDKKGLITENPDTSLPFVAVKKKATKRPSVDPKLAKLVLWFATTATFWLIFGTSIGEYVGIKFVAPDIDQASWLSFGRLRPVHTNSVFWGWASLGMLGLGYYSVPRVGNNVLFSYKLG